MTTTETESRFAARVIEFEGREYRVCVGNGATNNPPFYWLGKNGWHEPTVANARKTSRFRSRASAEAAIAKATTTHNL